MPLYLISYRKTDTAGQKPDWASFTTSSESSLEAHAIKERVEKRMSVLGEQLWGNGDVVWIGSSRLGDVLYRREEAAPEVSIVYGVVEQEGGAPAGRSPKNPADRVPAGRHRPSLAGRILGPPGGQSGAR